MGDRELFLTTLRCLHPDVPTDSFIPVIAEEPAGGWGREAGTRNQMIAAYKKWWGIVFMMDLDAANMPEYGLMMDSEVLLRKESDRGIFPQMCHVDGPWALLHSRIRDAEESKSFPAARVSTTLTTYDFGAFTKSGADYDRALIKENAHFAGYRNNCTSAGCERVRDQIEKSLFSWWTDLPWLNLEVAGRMLLDVAKVPALPGGRWRTLATYIRFTRFEYISYQQWCMMHEGFRIRDVTGLTGEAKWGSYMEDPLPGAQLAPLKPLWVSGGALSMSEQGAIPPMNENVPPLIIFHADKGEARAKREKIRADWRNTMQVLVQMFGTEQAWARFDQSQW